MLWIEKSNIFHFILAVKTTIIHPATEKHIEKYSVQNIYLIYETPDIYNSITLPHIEGEQFDLQVNNVPIITLY